MNGDNPHDSLFRFTFGRPGQAEAHFRATLPPAVVAAARWDTLAQQPGSFVDPAFAHLHTDLLYRVQLEGEDELRLYVLFERSVAGAGAPPDEGRAAEARCSAGGDCLEGARAERAAARRTQE